MRKILIVEDDILLNRTLDITWRLMDMKSQQPIITRRLFPI